MPVMRGSADAAQGAIDKRQAELGVTDALKAQQDLRSKGNELDPDVIAARKAVAEAAKAQAQSAQDERDARAAIEKFN